MLITMSSSCGSDVLRKVNYVKKCHLLIQHISSLSVFKTYPLAFLSKFTLPLAMLRCYSYGRASELASSLPHASSAPVSKVLIAETLLLEVILNQREHSLIFHIPNFAMWAIKGKKTFFFVSICKLSQIEMDVTDSKIES